MKTPERLMIGLMLATAVIPGCDRIRHAQTTHVSHSEESEHMQHEVWLTSPQRQDITITQAYVCQIRSCRHIDIRPLESGYLEEIPVREGQLVREGETLFTVLPAMFQARLEAERAEAEVARIEFNNTKKLVEDDVVSSQELALAEAKLEKAEAQVRLAEVELNFATIRAPFDGIIDRLHEQQGSLVDEGDILTTLSDNSVMWVYFNVPEARYLEYIEEENDPSADHTIELVLANGRTFPESGEIGAIEADFNNETGNIPFRADFPNPDAVLRHGQTGKILLHRTSHGALVIPQRVTFTVLAKRYVYVVDKDDIVRQREIVVDHELDDVFAIRSGLEETDRIILEGVAQVHDGQKLERYEFRPAAVALANLKYHAE
jgi:membrane fusion protein (multidrug efflux system)